ncbi:MAG: TIGR02301 family protein [Roseiarcus sp.]
MRPRVAIFAAALAAALAATPLAAQTPPFFFWLTPQTKPPAPAASPMPAPKPTAPAPEPTSTQAAKPPPWVETPAPEPPPPYEPQLLRLAEIIGALSYLRDLCGAGDGATFRAEFANLIDTEGTTPTRKETLAGAFNRGLRDYELTYRACTPAAREIVARFLDEAARIAKDVAARWAG